MTPQSFAHRFSFLAEEALYRDTQGRRVVADVEGRGSYRVDVADVPLHFVRDGLGSNAFQGSFDLSLSIHAAEAGRVSVRVWHGVPTVAARVRGRKFEGRGWLLAADRVTDLDGRCDPIGPDDLPQPFFRHVCGHGLEVALEGAPALLIGRISAASTNSLRMHSGQVQNQSLPYDLAGTFTDGTAHAAPVRSHLNEMSFEVELPLSCQGLRLRKTYDRFHGRQRAWVKVNGRRVGMWYAPVEDRGRRWAVAEFGIEPEHLPESGSVRIAIDPPAGTPLWSYSDLEIYALV